MFGNSTPVNENRIFYRRKAELLLDKMSDFQIDNQNNNSHKHKEILC
jgi:hypothetical protein